MQPNITYYSKYGPFAHKRTTQFTSDVVTFDGHTNTEISFYYLHGQMGETDGNQHQITYHAIMHSLIRIRNRIIAGRIISARHSENTFRNVVNPRFRCLTSIFSY